MTTLKAQSELDFSNKPQPDSQQIEDLEVKDAQLIFNAVWSKLWTNLVPPNCAFQGNFLAERSTRCWQRHQHEFHHAVSKFVGPTHRGEFALAE